MDGPSIMRLFGGVARDVRVGGTILAAGMSPETIEGGQLSRALVDVRRHVSVGIPVKKV